MDYEKIANGIPAISNETAATVLNICIKLRGTSNFKETMKEVIVGIRDLCDAEHCCVFVMNESERSCYVLCEAFGKDTALLPMENYVDDAFYDIADSWAATMAGNNCLIVKNEQDMEQVRERNPVWAESITSAGGHNIVMFPLKSRNRLVGYIWAINYDQNRTEMIRTTLEVTTFILGSELGTYMLLNRLKTLSSMDELTGVSNRNEMNNFINELSSGSRSGESVGVIFADVNCLKEINDVEGHSAGDLILRQAAGILKKIFPPEQIFRAGGDEFAIVLPGVTQAQLDAYTTRIREDSARIDNLFFALGSCAESECHNVRIALHLADQRMYEDKRRFYEESPEKAKLSRTDYSLAENDAFRKMNYDHLTGFASMTYFFKLAEQGRRNLHAEGKDSALVFFNLNGMKFYNKKYGFAEGDALIKEFAGIIARQFREERCSRFGQDHFAAYGEAEGLDKKLERIIRDMRSANGGRSLLLGIGVYLDSMGLVETSLACDRAKYACEANRDNRDSYCSYFDEAMLRRENNRQYIVENLDRAIAENWVRPFYQPIIRATARKVCDEEALARWIDPKKGMLSPADFIPILEDTKLIYKVDLHILDVVLERINFQKQNGHPVVPISINLSRTDFEACDMVEEIKNRVDTAGVSRDLITIEITESVIGQNFEFMREQIQRFQKLGFKVWMDDFGSGYSSLNLLLEQHFDLVKFDMRFMRQFDTNAKSRIMLTELMKMAAKLGLETVTEGVETEEQADFLSEIGCTRLQGFYFSKPLPFEEIRNRFENGLKIDFENAAETDYQSIISSISLYDLDTISGSDDETAAGFYFDMQPMALAEFDGSRIRISRSNSSFRRYAARYLKLVETGDEVDISEISGGLDAAFTKAIRECQTIGQKIFFSETMEEGETIHAFVKRIIDNPVKKTAAYVAAVLGITPKDKQALSFAAIAQALSADVIDLYHVDLKTEEFTQYAREEGSADISAERRGTGFFAQSRSDAQKYLHPSDRDAFTQAFTRENILNALDTQGVFTQTYRLMFGDQPQYVSMKAVRLQGAPDQIIFAVSNVDAQMKQQETLENLKAEKSTYSKISALMGDLIAIYTVDPDTGTYMEYSATDEYSDLGTSRIGSDFFTDSREESRIRIHPDDYDIFLKSFTAENVLATTSAGRIYLFSYRLRFGEHYVNVCLRAGLVKEKEGSQLIVGVLRE